MRTADFDFDLPDELIAQRPSIVRGESRLLVLPRHDGPVEHTVFTRLPEYLRSGDLLVLNDTRVFPARLLGRRVPTGGGVECLLVRRVSITTDASSHVGVASPARVAHERSEDWEALMHPGQKLKPGARVVFERAGLCLHGEVLARHFYGRRTIRLWSDDGEVRDVIEAIGHIPLPPYIARPDEASDRERYQTVFARESGSIAAPTAGLHFSTTLLGALDRRGIERVNLTLHVGYGTFKPVRAERLEEHEVDPETYRVSPEAAAALTRALREGRRTIAVGTTTTRAL
jgi:S-adenosylmethionine:tRNA ribosyltransferase-isomerase